MAATAQGNDLNQTGALPRRHHLSQRSRAGRQVHVGSDGIPRRRANFFGYAMASPTLLGVSVFVGLPILATLVLSFFSWNNITAPEFIGLANYRELVHDESARQATIVTVTFVGVAVPLQLALGLLLAMLIENQSRFLRPFFRSVFFFPLLTAAASVSLVFESLFNEKFGAINYYLYEFGIEPIAWLTSERWALITIIMVFLWSSVGFTLIVFLAALHNLPTELLDAAKVDGAVGLQRIRYVVLPLISPSTLFVAVVGTINGLQVFDQAYVLTRGGPGNATKPIAMVMYQQAFERLRFGYASAVAMVLFVLIGIVTAIQFVLSRRWVHYQ